MAKKSAIDLRNEYNKSKHNKASDSTYSTFEKTQSILGDSKSYMDTQSQYRQDVANNQIAYNNEMYRRKKELAEQQIFNDALDMIRSKRSWYKPADMEQANKDLYGSNDPNSAYNQAKNVYAGYTTKEAAQDAKKASSAASKNLEQAAKIYATYNDPVAKAYSKDLYNAADNYDQVSKDMGNAADIYGYYKTEDAYNAAVREQELKDKYDGYSFEEIEKAKANMDPSSDEYKFLANYGVKQGYQTESDYDKDIASRAVTEDDKVYATWNKLSDSYSYDDVKRIIDANNNNDLDSLWDDFDEDQVGEVISAYQFHGMDVEEQAFHDSRDLERAKNQYHQEHTFDRYYNSIVANSDFPILSQYGYNPLSNASIEASSDKKYSDDLSSGEDDLKKVYEYMNTNPEKIDELWTFGFSADYKEKGYAFASKEEREVFNYLYNSRDLDKARAYLEEMEPIWTKRREEFGDEVLSNYYDDANVAEKIALNIGSSGLNLVGGIQSGANMLGSIVSGKDYNPYAALSEASRLSAGIRQNTGEEIAKNTSWEVAGRNVGQFAYNTIASTLDSATGVALLGPSYAVVASGNVFNQTAEQMIGKGYSQDEIWLTAGSAAVAEALFEKYSIDKLVSIPRSTGWKNILKSAFKQGGIEASEEVVTEMSNLITDTLFRGGTSELSEMYDEYIKRGFTEEEAKKEIQKEIIARITEAGLGGFFSGGIMGGFQSATGAYQNKKIGENISSESMDKMAERASDIENLSKDGKNIVNKHQNNPEEVTDAEKGALYDELYNLDHEIVKEVSDEIKDTADKKNGRVVSYEESEDAVDINDISDIKLSDSGKILLYSKSESKWMKASDVKVNSMDASTIANMAAVFAKTDETKAKTFLANYSDRISAQDYIKVFNKLMNGAIRGYSLTELLENDKTIDMLSKKMTDEEIANIYMYAKNVEQGIIDKSTSAEQVSIVQNIADKAGINLVFDDDIKNANGFYRDSDGTIHLSKRSINPLTVVFSHEFVHYLAANDSENFNRLKAVGSDYLMKADPEKYKEIINEKSSIYAKEIVEWKKAGLNIADKLNEEITAHMTEAVMQDITSKSEKEIRRFTDSLYEENPGIVQKIKDFIHDMLTKVKNALAGYKATSTEAKELLKNKEQLELFEKCLIESMTKKETGDIETKTNTAKTSNLVSSEGKMMSIKSTTDGRSVAVIDDDILDGVAEADYINKVKKVFQGIHIVKTKYSSFSMNAKDKREYLNAKYSMYLARNEQNKFYDKLRAAKYVGDIFVASSDYVDEESKHHNYNSFGRGKVLLQIGNNQYSAEVVIGVTKSGAMHFYDIVNINKEQFTIKNPDRATSSTNSARVRSDLDSKNIVSNNSDGVNNYNTVDKSIKNANTNEENAYDYFTDAYITNGSGLLRKGFEIIKKNGFKIEPGEVSDIVSKMISDEESKISQEAFEQRVTALFNYMRSQKQLTSKDIMKITSEITADLIKKSKTFEGSDEELYSRSYEAALRLYQYYFSTRNRKISNKIEDVTQKLRDSFNERMKKAGANRALTEIKKQIYTKKQTLDRMLTNPTKGSHVPAHLVKTAVAFAEAVNTERSKMGYKANEQAKKVREAYQNLKNDETFSNFQYDEELEEYLKTVESIFENKNVANLTIEEANMVNKVLKALIVQIRNYNRLVSSKRAEDLKEASSGAIIEMVNVKAYDPTKTLSRLSNWYQSEALNFERLMKRTFGYTKNSWGQKMVDILKGAEIESLKDVREAEAIFHDVLSGNTQEERKENRKKVLEFTGKNEKGKYDMETWVTLPYSEEKVPRSVRMSMLMNLLNMDNARHAAYGGFTIPDTVELLRGNYVEAYDKGHYYKPAFYSEDFLEEAKKYANQFEYYDMELGKIVVNKNNPYLKEYKRKITQYENLNKSKVYKLHESKINKLKEELQNQKDKNKRAEIGKELNKLYQDLDEEYKARKRYLKESASKAWDEYQKAYADAMNAIEDKIKRSAEEYVSEIKEDMNEYEKEFLSKAQEFFSEFSADKINEVSMNLYGYKKASVKNYYPIKVDADTIATDSPSIKFDGTLEGSGILKKRVISRKPILMEDITQTVQRHIKQVSNFHGYAEAVRDVKGILNYTDNQKYMSLRKMIRQKWGDAVMKQIDQVIADIESPRTNRSWITKKMSDMRSMFAGATLTGNIGVMLKQAASYPTAAAEVGWKSLQKALKNSGKTGIKEVEERTPLLYYRESGYSTQELGDLKNMKVSENKFKFFTGMISWMDIRTVRKLEYAAMYYVDDNTNLEKGSDEYWDAVTEKFNDIVRRTQPNYTMLERPELLRDPDSLLRTLFMFKTQPLQNYGILYDAVNEYKALKKMNAKKEDMDAAKTQLARAVTSNLAAQAVFSLITILVNLLYHRPDDYIEEETKEFDWGKFGFRFVSGMANAEAGMLAFGSEMYSYIESRIFGTKYYGVSDSVVDQINNITDGMSNFFDSLEKISDAKTEAKKEEAVKKTLYRGRVMATAIGQLFGIPVNNIYKPINSMVAYTQDIINGEIWSGKGILPYNPDVESQYDRIIDSIIEDDLDRFDKLKNELIDASEASDPEKTTIDGIKNKAIKKAYISGQIDEEKAKKYLLHLGYDEEKANNYIADFISAKYSDSIDDMIGASGSVDINSQVKEKVKESVKAGEMTEKEAIDYLVKAGYDKNEAYFEVQKIEYDKMYGHLLNEISSQAKSGNANQKILNDIVKEYTSHGKDKSDVASSVTSAFKSIYLDSNGSEKTNLYAILLKAYQACGLTRKEAEDRIKKWKK